MEGMTITIRVILPEVEIAEICRRYDIEELALFGSMALGQGRSDSDIDLLVENLPNAQRGLLRPLTAQREFQELLGRKVDMVPKNGLRKEVRAELLADAKLIYAA